MKLHKLSAYGLGAFVVTFGATLAFGQARVPFTRPPYLTTSGPISTTSTVAASSYNSTVASGNQAFTCTNVGCRLSLGNTGRYLVDDGTNLEFVAPVQGTSFEALTTSGSSFTGGNSSAAMTLTSNTPDSVTSSTVPAIRLQASQNITNADLLLSVEDSANNRIFTVTENGTFTFLGNGTATFLGQLFSYSQYETANGNFTGNGASAGLGSNINTTGNPSVILRANTNRTAADVKLVSIRNNTTDEKAFFDLNGLLRLNAGNAAKPTCNSDNRGRLFFLDGAAGVADTMEVCMKDSANNYDWETVASP